MDSVSFTASPQASADPGTHIEFLSHVKQTQAEDSMNTVAFSNEAGAGLPNDALPAYAPMLAALHRACASELHAIIAELPLQPGANVLDMACGDGVYLAWLAQRVGPTGSVVGVDLSPAFLQVAAQTVQSAPNRERIRLEQADINALPYADATFDAVWCAHSLYSLPDPLRALRELRRVVRPGGHVMILENDTLHSHLLPWPAELELAVRQAQLEHLQTTSANSTKFFAGRHLCELFDLAGLTQCQLKTYTLNHQAPLSADERTFYSAYLSDLRQRAADSMDAETQAAFEMLVDPASPVYLLNQANFFATHLEIVAIGQRPG